jgi:hypothetical protein
MIYDRLEDSFDYHDGRLADYILNFNAPTPDLLMEPHYDIRSFYSDNPTVPWTMNDMEFWHVGHFAGMTMDELVARRSTAGRTFRRHLQSEIEVFNQATLDEMTMFDLDFAVLSAGNEEWSTSDPDVTVARISGKRYRNQLTVALTNGVEKVVTSRYNDDLLTDFNDPGKSYWIEIALPNFPSQGAAAHLDLTNSYIEFTSSDTWDPAVTDSIKFDVTSLFHSVNGGGDTYVRFPRTALTHVDLTDIKGIRFRLLATGGNFNFVSTAIRLITNLYAYHEIDINTKRGTLARSLPRDGENEPGTTFSPIYFGATRPKNITYFVRFNSGHNPTGNDNTFRLFLRYNPANGDQIEVKLNARDTQSRLRVFETVDTVTTEIGNTPTLTNILTQSTEYFLKVTLTEDTVKADIYTTFGIYPGTLVYTTGSLPVSRIRRGYVGYAFEPYNYDFEVYWLQAQSAEFATYESADYLSGITPVAGATLYAVTSPAMSVFEGTLVGAGDATTSDSLIGQPGPAVQVTRTGGQWFGGVVSTEPIALGTPSMLSIEGDLFPIGQLRGFYRVALVDANLSVGYITHIPNLLANQWNHFYLRLSVIVPPAAYYLHVQQAGFYDDEFVVDNIRVNHSTISWSASPDGGTTWYPFLDALNAPYTAAHFGAPGTDLKIKAIAFSDRAWIAPYQVRPIYAFPGHS